MVRPSFNLYLAAVVCNLEGLVLAQVEALAARRAIELPIELGFIRIILEGDFFVIITALSSDDPSLASFGHMIFYAKQLVLQLNILIFPMFKEMQ